MSTISDVQNAIVNVLSPAIYPSGTSQPSVALNKVTGVTVTAPGSGYTSASVTLNGTGQNAFAYPSIVNGTINAIVMTPAANGFGYATAPSVVITGDGTLAAATASISPINVYIAPGDFLKRNLDDGLRNGDAFISVFAVNGMTRNTTRLRRDYTYSIIDTPTITITVLGDTITIGGTITAGQVCMAIVNDVGYAVAAISTSTPTTLATALAALIPTATSIGPVITVPGVFNIVARISTGGTSRRILHTFESIFRVRVIASSHELREFIGDAAQLAIAEHVDSFGNEYYLDMPDLISASIRPNRIMEVNTNEFANAFARDYLYLVEYHVVEVNRFQTIADIDIIVDVGIV
jgi:hypothetical protein